MKGLKSWLVTLIAGCLLLAVSLETQAHEHEAWYVDMGGHWAEREVRTLWEEGVTDGEAIFSGSQTAWYFRPNDHATRAQFGLLAAKVFQLEPHHPPTPTFADLGPGYRFYTVKRPYPHIEAAVAAGIIRGLEGGVFAPSASITREHAVAMLVRALGLEPFARAHTAEQHRQWLAAFSDRDQVDPELGAEVALAARLGILRGYPDGTLRPQWFLTRAEAAAIFYRSAVFRLAASPERFHPDGDGYRETTDLHFNYLANRNVTRWRVEITNQRGLPVATTGVRQGTPPARLTWDGRDDGGAAVPDGLYFYQGWLDDRLDQRFAAVPRPLYLERRSLGARLEPTAARTGETVTVWAWTRGGANTVTARHDGWQGQLARVDTNAGEDLWRGTFTVPPGIAPELGVTVRAAYPGASRQVNLALTRLDALWVTGEVEPNPAPAGTEVTIRAFTPADAESVTFQAHEAPPEPLQRVGDGLWTASYTTDPAEEGPVPITLRVTRAGLSAESVVWLELTETPLAGVVFVLVD